MDIILRTKDVLIHLLKKHLSSSVYTMLYVAKRLLPRQKDLFRSKQVLEKYFNHISAIFGCHKHSWMKIKSKSNVRLHPNIHPCSWHVVHLHFLSFKYRKNSKGTVCSLFQKISCKSCGWIVFTRERETTNRVVGVYPPGSLRLFLSHKQIFIFPVRPDISHTSSIIFSFSFLHDFFLLWHLYLCALCVWLFVPPLPFIF